MDTTKHNITIPYEDYLVMKDIYEKSKGLMEITPENPMYNNIKMSFDRYDNTFQTRDNLMDKFTFYIKKK